MAGLVATFIFAAQMINFPVGAGTSGHLMGGTLAAVLVGPWTAVLCMSVVLLVQGLVMADGGITALGTNITLMGMIAAAVGWCVFVLLRRARPALTTVAPAAAIGAFVSVPIVAIAFTGLFAVRRGDRVWVYVNSCPHVGLPLDPVPHRFLDAKGQFIVCSAHGARFRIEDGECVSGPCYGEALEAVEARIEDGDVVVPAEAGL